MPAHRDPPLTVDEIIDAAMSVTAEHGLDGLTMRAVSEALGVTPMSLYHHVGDKDALIDLAADAVVAGVAVPAPDLAWDQWLCEYHDALWKRLNGYPGLARHLLEHPATPAGGAIRLATVELLVDRGFSDPEALLAAATFHTHLLGRLAVEALPAAAGANDEPAWRSYGLTASDYTAHGLRTIVEGLRVLHDRSTTAPRRRTRPSPSRMR